MGQLPPTFGIWQGAAEHTFADATQHVAAEARPFAAALKTKLITRYLATLLIVTPLLRIACAQS